MAIVNRICGTKSCQMGQTMKEGKFSDWIQQQSGVKFEVPEVLVSEVYVALQGSQPNYLSWATTRTSFRFVKLTW